MNIKIPEPICKECKRLIQTGRPFCYECMKCGDCSPDCFEEEDFVKE